MASSRCSGLFPAVFPALATALHPDPSFPALSEAVLAGRELGRPALRGASSRLRSLTGFTSAGSEENPKTSVSCRSLGRLTATAQPSPDVSALVDIKHPPAFILPAMTFSLGPVGWPAPQCSESAWTITPAHESISCRAARRNRAAVRRNSSSPIERRRRRRRRSGRPGSFILRYDETRASGLLTREQHATAAPYGSPFRTLICSWG